MKESTKRLTKQQLFHEKSSNFFHVQHSNSDVVTIDTMCSISAGGPRSFLHHRTLYVHLMCVDKKENE